MGVVLDSSVLISAERRGSNVRQMLALVRSTIGETEAALSVVSLIELAHGAARADTQERRQSRERFIQDVITGLPIHSVTVSAGLRAGRIDGENRAKGLCISLADLLIGVTALELDYAVATANPRHFEQIPGLLVIKL
jgi:predicted nucleic acid-binding protein